MTQRYSIVLKGVVLLVILGSWLNTLVHAQQNPTPEMPKVIQPAPNAAALGKYGDLPVSLYSGTPSVSIPLYNLQVGDLSLPISMDYHSGGIRVSELAGWTGLGWSLNAGGVVSRNMMDKDDLTKLGSSYTIMPELETSGTLPSTYKMGVDWNNVLSSSANELFDFTSVYSDFDGLDTQMDLFNFNFPGNSGKFVLKQNDLVVLTKKADLKIFINPGTYVIEITNENGVKHIFNPSELASQSPMPGNYITSWYLNRIESPSGHWIQFVYETTTIPNLSQFIQTHTIGGHADNGSNTTRMTTFTQAVILNKIYGSNGDTVKLLIDNGRLDYSSKRIRGIKVYEKGDTIADKAYDFKYSYFSGNTRMRLDEIVERANVKLLPPHRFTYVNSTYLGVPSLESKSTDDWGYFNGAPNTDVIPKYLGPIGVNYITTPDMDGKMELTVYTNDFMELYGADKTTNPQVQNIFSLQKIEYPTGGYSTLEMESNTFEYDNTETVREAVLTRVKRDTLLSFNTIGDTQGYLDFIGGRNISEVSATLAFICVTQSTGCALCRAMPEGSLYFELNGVRRDITGSFVTCGGPQCQAQLTVPIGQFSVPYKAHIASNLPSEFVQINLNLSWIENVYNFSSNKKKFLYGGGLRIKRLSNYDADGTIISSKTYDYHYKADVNADGILEEHSHGRRMAPPSYLYGSTVDFMYAGHGPVGYAHVLNRVSNSITPAGSIGYDQVTEYQWNTTNTLDNGKSASVFANTRDSLTSYQTSSNNMGPKMRPPGATNISYGNNGALLSKTDYKRVGTSYIPVTQVDNTYQIKNGKYYFNILFETHDAYLGGQEKWLFIYPVQRVEQIKLQKTVTRSYETLAKYQEEEVTYGYGQNHEQAISITKKDSRGRVTIQRLIYTPDYSLSSTPYGVLNLQSKNMIAPIEQYTIVDNKVIGGTLTTFKESVPYPDKIYRLDLLAPLHINNFNSSNKTPGTFTIDNNYKPKITYTQYDTKGNILEVSKVDDKNLTYLWGYDKRYPVAEIQNAPMSQVAYTSFEGTTNDGNWTFSGNPSVPTTTARTGIKTFTLTSSSISFISLPAGKYKLSFFGKGTITVSPTPVPSSTISKADIDGWTLYSHVLDLASATTVLISGTGELDELRLHPVNATMSTYTYKALTGYTSTTDPNMVITYYEYDIFNRLSMVRDHKKNFLKTFKYNYKAQQ